MEELSPREAEVLELVGSHLSNPQIGERLYISVRTVESHVASLIRKLEVPDRRALVAYAAAANRPATGIPDSRARHNLPVARSSFVGRAAERQQLAQMVKAEALVTLTGIGGCGKSRLALSVSSDLEADFDNGAFFVDLSTVSDPTLVGQAVAGALSLQMVNPTPDALAEYFAGRETLLLFDNCEHLLDACAEVADALLGERCPGLRILATSREPLGLEGERVFRVPSLNIAEEAVVLFVDRAKDARSDVSTDLRTDPKIAEICRRLDGIPLAIELAAGRVAHMSPSEILERLNDRFALLVGGRRRIPRQQTLTAALDWSYDLLGQDEQLLLCRLAVFRGSFSLRAAEAICHPKAMDLLGSLVAKSLVSLIDVDEVVRYRLLESVRLYAEEKLIETGESQQLRSAHRDFYLERIESVPLDEIVNPFGAARLALEADNLTAALEWCRQQGQYDLCSRIAVRMGFHWYTFCQLSEMLAWWRVLDAGLPAEDRDHRAMALLLRSIAAHFAGDAGEFELYSAQASELAGPHSWIAAEVLFLQAARKSLIDPARGGPLFRQSFQIAASLGLSPHPAYTAPLYLSRLRRATGRNEALALLGDWLADLGDSTPLPQMHGVFALFGETETAVELKSRTSPMRTPVARFTAALSDAVLASAQGQFDYAEQHLATMTSVMRDFAVPGGEAGCLAGFAKLALDRGDYALAARLLASLDSSVGRGSRITQDVLLICSRVAEILREILDPESLRSARSEGSALSLKEALDAELARGAATAVANPSGVRGSRAGGSPDVQSRDRGAALYVGLDGGEPPRPADRKP